MDGTVKTPNFLKYGSQEVCANKKVVPIWDCTNEPRSKCTKLRKWSVTVLSLISNRTKKRSELLQLTDHFPNTKNFERPCAHNGPTYSRVKISEQDIIALRKRVLHTPDKAAQDRKLSYFYKVQAPKRRRESYKPNCRVQKHRLHTITKNMMCGKDIKENRGGDHCSTKNLTKRNNVVQFSGMLKAKGCHYNKRKSRRLYLPTN
nr:unnamed protein product [Callosobruchus analis]